ncbi:MAG: nicotinate-nucleotide--dimethylbenzimidazole phosphoribosyltransferase [Deltaproteobacteria bacterium]
MSLLKDTLDAIQPTDEAKALKAQARLDDLTKPKDSLGRLEEFARRLVSITGDLRPRINKRLIFTFAGDHGVASEGVSAFPKEVTPQMVFNFLRKGAGINVLAAHAGAEVIVVDIGVDFDFAEASGLVRKKVVRGTKNIRTGPAMTTDEAVQCIETGIALACEYASQGVIFGTGEMGIANTTSASAIAAAITGEAVSGVTGRGTGITDEALSLKVKVIEDCLKANNPDPDDPIDVLTKLGGAEIAGIAGLILGAAARRVPVVVDGFISTAGALIAYGLKPVVKEYMFSAHLSQERGHRVMLDRMGLRPILDLDMRLGEGTGAALAMSIIEAGLKIYNGMATFSEAGVSEKNV